MYWCIKHKYFETIILIAIIASSVALVIDTYIDSNNPDHAFSSYILDLVDLFFTFFFAIEAILKSVSLGFIMNDGSYLRDSWNKLDCFIVAASLIDLIL